MTGMRILSAEECRELRGGSILYSLLAKFAEWGIGYFYRMGVQEGKRMRAQL